MSRNQSVDVVRILAILGVISIHTKPFLVPEGFPNDYYELLYVLINQLSRFAVPFFFVISGYYWGRGADAAPQYWDYAWQRAKRLIIVLLIWSVVYLLPYNVWGFGDHGWAGPVKLAYWHALDVFSHPIDVFFGGTKVQLWYLVALIWATLLCGFFLQMGWRRWLPFAAVGLYVTGVFAKAYKLTPLGLSLPFDSVYGPLFSTILFATGYWLSRQAVGPTWFKRGLIIYLLGLLIHFSEIWVLKERFNTYPIHDYVFGTYLLGVGVAIMALSKSISIEWKWLPTVGSYTLGVYLSHFIFVDLFAPINRQLNNPVWEIGEVLLVYVCSLALTMLLMRNRFTKKMVVLSR